MRSFKWLAGLGGAACFALLGAVNGCSSSSDHPAVLGGIGNDSGHPSSSSGGVSGSGSSSGGGPMCLSVDGGCTDLQLCGSQVNVHDATGTPPAPQGGAILPGTYVLTSVDYYGSGIAWLQQTFRLTASGGDGGAAEGGNNDAAAAEAGGGDGSPSEAGSEGGSEGGGMGPDATIGDAAGGGDAGGGNGGQSLAWESILLTDSMPLSTTNGTLSMPSPSTISIAFACGSSGPPFTAGYTATPTTLAFIVVDNTTSEVLTFTKQ